jgi:dTDP-4-dehydrorhamnose 3,5-epimerase
MFADGEIHDVLVKDLAFHHDRRGWLAEIFRDDELEERYRPVMSYISMTYPGIARGPHEHRDQADYFGFLGPSTFKVYLWDGRKTSPTFRHKQVVFAGEETPKSIIIPAGVVHAYKNIGEKPGLVVNCPNRLFAGEGKKYPVDEIRYEEGSNTIYKLD